MIKNTISDLYDEFEFVKENLSVRKKEKYDLILFNRVTEATWKLSLLDLTKYLYEYYGKKVVVLIDEYDQPIIDSYVKGYYQEAISFFKTFYGARRATRWCRASASTRWATRWMWALPLPKALTTAWCSAAFTRASSLAARSTPA